MKNEQRRPTCIVSRNRKWKDASGLQDSSGDPDGVTPEAAQRYWEAVEREHAALLEYVELLAKEGAEAAAARVVLRAIGREEP